MLLFERLFKVLLFELLIILLLLELLSSGFTPLIILRHHRKQYNVQQVFQPKYQKGWQKESRNTGTV